MTVATWRVKTLPLAEWSDLQDRFGQLQMASGGSPDLAMFQQRVPGETDAVIFITGPRIEVIEQHSPGGWKDAGAPQGKGTALLVGAADAWDHFGIEKPST